MSTSKQYPYFGTYDNDQLKASIIVHFVAPNTGTVVWSSDPEYQEVGAFDDSWFEDHFMPTNDPFTVDCLIKALVAVTKPAVNQQLYILLEMEGNIPDTVSYNINTLKEEARIRTEGGYLMWEQFGEEWVGRDRDQNDAMWGIRPVSLV